MPAYRYENEQIENKCAIAFDEHFNEYIAKGDRFGGSEKVKLLKKAIALSKAREDEIARNKVIEQLNKYREADFLGLTEYRLMRRSNLKEISARYYIEIETYCPEVPSAIYQGYKDLAQYKSRLEDAAISYKGFQFYVSWIQNAISKIDTYFLHQKLSSSLENKAVLKKVNKI